MDEDTTDRAMYEQDLQNMERQAIEALKASTVRSLTEDEAMLLAWCAGVSINRLYKEIRNES